MKKTYNNYRDALLEHDLTYRLKGTLDVSVLCDIRKELLKDKYYDLYGQCMYMICSFYARSNNFDYFTPFFDEFSKIAKKEKGFTQIYNLLVDGLVSMYYKGDVYQCVENGEKALAIYNETQINNQLALFEILQTLGMANTAIRDNLNSHKYLSEALKCKIPKPFIFCRGTIYLWIGNLEVRMYNYGAGINNYLKAITLFRKYIIDFSLSNTLIQLGYLYLKLYKNEEAFEVLNEGLDIAISKGYEQLKCDANVSLGIYYRQTENYEKALEHLLPTLKIKNNLYGQQHENIACVYFFMNEYEKAIKYYTEALEIYTQTKDNHSIFWSYIHIARVLLKQKNYDETKEYINKAEEMITLLNDDNYKMALYELYMQYYNEKEQYKEAVSYSKKYAEIMKSINQEKLQTNPNFYEMKNRG